MNECKHIWLDDPSNFRRVCRECGLDIDVRTKKERVYGNNTENTRCIVAGCTNHKHEGTFVGDICAPCFDMITSGKVTPKSPSDNFIYKDREKLENKVRQYIVMQKYYVHDFECAFDPFVNPDGCDCGLSNDLQIVNKK